MSAGESGSISNTREVAEAAELAGSWDEGESRITLSTLWSTLAVVLLYVPCNRYRKNHSNKKH